MGTKEHLEKLTLDLMKADFTDRYHANGAILAMAGNLDFESVKREVQKYFGDWKSGKTQDLKLMHPPGNYFYEEQKSEQTHIAIAYNSIPEPDRSTTRFEWRWKSSVAA